MKNPLSGKNEVVIKIDERYFRPSEVASLIGDPKLAKEKLGWIPKITLEEIITEMIDNDKKEALKESILIQNGFNVSKTRENPPSS